MRELDITVLQKAEKSFAAALAQRGELEEKYYEVYRAAIIQNFEFCFELSWKFMQRWLRAEDDVALEKSPTKKEVFRLAYNYGLIKDASAWNGYLELRNLTTHTYNEHAADEVYAAADSFCTDFHSFITELEKKL